VKEAWVEGNLNKLDTFEEDILNAYENGEPISEKPAQDLQAELERRLAAFEAKPEAGYAWEEVKSRLKNGSWRTV